MNVKKLATIGLSIILAVMVCFTVLPPGLGASAAPANTITVANSGSITHSYSVSTSSWETMIGWHKAGTQSLYCLDDGLPGPSFGGDSYSLNGLASDYVYSILWHSRNLYGSNPSADVYYATSLCIYNKAYMTNGTVGQDTASQRCLDMAKAIRNAHVSNPKTPSTTSATVSISEVSGGYISGSNYVIGTYQVTTNASDYSVIIDAGYSTSGMTVAKLANKQFRVTVPLSNISGGYYVRANVNVSVDNDAAYVYTRTSGTGYQRLATLSSSTSTKTAQFEKQQDDPTGTISLYKRDSGANALLAGATFKVTNKTTGDVYFALTNASGFAYRDYLPIGTYKIEEVTAPNGYVIGNNVWDNVQITETITDHTFTAYNAPQVGQITVYKRDVETGAVPQGDAILNGAKFNIVNSSGTVVQTLTLNGTSATTGSLPLGTYSIVETQAPTGYKLAGPVVVTIAAADQTIEVVSKSATVSDEVIKGSIRVNKTGNRKLGVTDDGTKPALSGVEFQVRLKSTGTLYDTITTDANGNCETVKLPYGTYEVIETKGATGYQMSSPFEVVINSEGAYDVNPVNNAYASQITIVKKDSTTEKVIPFSGTQFGIKDATGSWIEQNGTHIFSTDNTGKVTLPQTLAYGNYTLVELKAPAGYTLNVNAIPFTVFANNLPIQLEMKNDPVKGIITVTKTGEILSSVGADNTPVYSNANLRDAEFNVVAASNIVTPDGTVRYTAGTVVDTLRTDASGKDTTIPLFLGTYEIVETKAPAGHVLDSTPHSVTLSYVSQDIPLVTESRTYGNTRQKVSISFNKNFETAEGQTEVANGATTFGLFAAEDITAADGKKIPKDGLIETLQVKVDGSVVTSVDLPIAAYYVKELTTHEGYVINDSEYIVTYQAYNQNTVTLQGKVNGDTMLSNLLKRGDLVVQKTAEGENLEGFEFRIHGTTVVGTVYDQTFTTDATGKITVTGLLVGTYEIVELSNTKTIGYILPDAQTVVMDKAETFTVAFDNRYERHNLTIKKTSEDGKIEGFAFRVTGTTLVGTDYDETFTTDENGMIVIEGLLLGTYTITEVANDVSKPYVLVEAQTVEITAGATEPFEVFAYNALLRGSTDLVKVDARTGKGLAGVQFVITDASGNIIATLVTDENGVANTGNLPYGVYFIIEVKAQEGYVLDNTQREFSITEHKQIVEFRLVNSKISGNIEIKKTDETGSPMPGVEFTIINQDTNEVVEVLTTDKDGYAKSSDLDFGNYILKETKTPDGYLSADDQHFSITKDEEIITYEVINMRSPQTGEPAPILAIVLIAFSMSVLILAKRRKAKSKAI